MGARLSQWVSLCPHGCQSVLMDARLSPWVLHCPHGCQAVQWLPGCPGGFQAAPVGARLSLWVSHYPHGCQADLMDARLSPAMLGCPVGATLSPQTPAHLTRLQTCPGLCCSSSAMCSMSSTARLSPSSCVGRLSPTTTQPLRKSLRDWAGHKGLGGSPVSCCARTPEAPQDPWPVLVSSSCPSAHVNHILPQTLASCCFPASISGACPPQGTQ